jgi:hypothetical protein
MSIYSERTSNDVPTLPEAGPLAPMWHVGSPRAVQSGMPLLDDRDAPDLLIPIGAIDDDGIAPPLAPTGYRGSAGRMSSSPVGDYHHEADLQSPPTLVHDLLSAPWLAWRTYPRIGLVGGMALGVSAAAALAFVAVKNFPVQHPAGAQRMASAASAPPSTFEARLANSPAVARGTDGSRTAPPQLIATTASGRGAEEPLQLGLALRGEPAGAVLMISGLPQGAALSRGKRASATAWRLDPGGDLDDVAVRPPPRFSGAMNLTAELQLDGETVDRRSVRLEWSGPVRTAQAQAAQAQPQAQARTAAAPLPQAASGRPPVPAQPQRPATAVASAGATDNLAGPPTVAVEPRDRDVDALIARGQRLMRAKDIASARQVLQRAADSGDPRVALSLGETYDPVMLERLGLRGGVGDIGQARAWYARAQGLGSTEAPRRLKLLANR